MTAESDAFEQLNARITKLMYGQGTSVDWDTKIPDPDDPNIDRQIDVLITTSDQRLISVECRQRTRAQDVMWIEELAGRKDSLKLDGMIAVSFKGFSKLAQKKAKRYGIPLYDFQSLTDEEIVSWADSARVEAAFVQFDTLNITAGVPQAAEPSLSQKPNLQYVDKDGYSAIMDLLRDDVVANPGVQQSRKLNPQGFSVDSVPITVLSCDYSGRLFPVVADCTTVSTVGRSGDPAELRDITVQKFDHSIKEIIQKDDNAHLLVDVSCLRSPSNAILHEIKVSFSAKTTVSRYELIGKRTILADLTNVMLEVVTTA